MKNKKVVVKAWAVLTPKKKEPWGVIVSPRILHHIGAWGVFETFNDAIEYKKHCPKNSPITKVEISYHLPTKKLK